MSTVNSQSWSPNPDAQNLVETNTVVLYDFTEDDIHDDRWCSTSDKTLTI